MPKRPSGHMEAQRERILHATLRCISELGIERTSIVAIRKESGLSAGALYTHFPNKEAIVTEALRFGSVKEAYLPDTWPEFIAAVASMSEEDGFDSNLVARTQLQVFAMAIRPGDQHELLKPIIKDALNLVTDHLAKMEEAGRVRLRLNPRQTAIAIGAIKDGVMWNGLALDRSRHEIEADITAAVACLASPLQEQGAGEP